MNLNKIKRIPISKISERSDNGIVLRHLTSNSQSVIVNQIHRDNYYIFIFVESGMYKACIDFEEYQLKEKSIAFIQPGQIHFSIEYTNVIGWLLAVDTMLINSELKEILERTPIKESVKNINEDIFLNLNGCISILYKKTQTPCSPNLLSALISSCTGLIAEVYQNNNGNAHNGRPIIITHQFRKLLSENYKSIKSPFRYASALNLSPSYLNEIVKVVTGQTVSELIQNEVILQAKRFLFHTDMTIKEIANELGYEDHAYFTRLFTKITGSSPTHFKTNYRK